MIISEEELKHILETLAKSGNTYLCEKQFQFDLAWELRKHFESQDKTDCHVYLEYPSRDKEKDGSRIYYDIVIKENDTYCVIELKYKTSKGKTKLYGEEFDLKDQAAQDLGRYDFLKDVTRIENFEADNEGKSLNCGYAVFLTNDSSYWNKDGKNYLYKDFALNNDRDIPNTPLKWKKGFKESSVGKNRKDGLAIKGAYTANWHPFKGEFQYLMFEIK